VGRVTEQLLLAHCAEVDLVEPSRHLLAAARASLAPSTSARDGGAAGDGSAAAAGAARGYPPGHAAAGFFEMGLQAFSPAPKRRARARPRASGGCVLHALHGRGCATMLPSPMQGPPLCLAPGGPYALVNVLG